MDILAQRVPNCKLESPKYSTRSIENDVEFKVSCQQLIQYNVGLLITQPHSLKKLPCLIIRNTVNTACIIQ